jgi:hypothetical protein
MAKEKIVFDITPDGMKIETVGYTGDMCLKELEKFRAFMKKEGGIDLEVTDFKKKPEFFNANKITQKNKEVS